MATDGVPDQIAGSPYFPEALAADLGLSDGDAALLRAVMDT